MQAAVDATKASYEDLTKYPSKYKAILKDNYAEATKQAQQRYKEARSAFAKQQKTLHDLSDEKFKMQSYVDERRRDATDLTLADIVEPDSQYEGTKKGRSDHDRFHKMTGEDQKRNLQRWQTAKSAVESLAKDASKRLKYMQFRAASRDAKGNLQPPASGRTRIGGNDFF